MKEIKLRQPTIEDFKEKDYSDFYRFHSGAQRLDVVEDDMYVEQFFEASKEGCLFVLDISEKDEK